MSHYSKHSISNLPFLLQTQTFQRAKSNLTNHKPKPTLQKPIIEYTKLPKILNTSTDIELVSNLNLESTDNLLNKTIREIRERKEIESNEEINNKRKGIKIQSNDPFKLQYNEGKSSINREFFKKYEIIQQEKIMGEEINSLKREIDKLKAKKYALYDKVILSLNKIDDCYLEVYVIENDLHEKKKEIINNMNTTQSSDISKKKKKKDQKNIDDFILRTLSMKDKAIRTEKKNQVTKEKETQIEQIKEFSNEIKNLKAMISKLKKNLENKVNILSSHYHKILYQGLDTRQEGLVWVIKAIWNLGENVKLSFFPNFLDQPAIDYLFTIAHKEIEISELKTKIDMHKKQLHKLFAQLQQKENSIPDFNLFKTTVSNDKEVKVKYDIINGNKRKSIVNVDNLSLKEMDNILKQNSPIAEIFKVSSFGEIEESIKRKDILEEEFYNLRENELKRIFKECIENDYEKKHNVSVEVLISALVGESNKDMEMIHFSKVKKNYIDGIKSIQYFSICRKPKNMVFSKLGIQPLNTAFIPA